MDPSLEEGHLHFEEALSTDAHVTLAETAPLEDTQEEIIIQTDDSENVYEASIVDSSDLQGTVLHISDSENMLDTASSIMGIKYENNAYLTDSSVDLEPSASTPSSVQLEPSSYISPNERENTCSSSGIVPRLLPVSSPTSEASLKFVLLKNRGDLGKQDSCADNETSETIIITTDETKETSCQALFISSADGELMKMPILDSTSVSQEELIVIGKSVFDFIAHSGTVRKCKRQIQYPCIWPSCYH